jgi:murein DD-endopeptidase MepM/ murein hydrolase activator NlpD
MSPGCNILAGRFNPLFKLSRCFGRWAWKQQGWVFHYVVVTVGTVNSVTGVTMGTAATRFGELMRSTPTAGVRWSVRRRHLRFGAIVSVLGVLSTASIVSGAVAPASAATSYPTWGQVQSAKHNTALKKREVAQIQSLIKSLDAEVTATTADSKTKGDAYGTAQDAYYAAAVKQEALQAQAVAAEKTRKTSEAEAGQLAAQLARSGTNGFQLNLFLNGANASDMLDSIGDASKISERTDSIYKQAVQDKNTAQALTSQANVAKSILDNLKVIAQTAYESAQKAADAAAAALDASTQHKTELQAQLTAMTSNLKLTESKYLKGVQARYGFTGSIGTQISSSGWARPAAGVISSGFGMRVNPVDGGYRLHNGTDLAAGCGVPIYAAHSGTVSYSGWYGGLGNFIQIQDDATYATGYGHIMNGGLLVHDGQAVHVGQLIARTGETGEATGCHLHFMVIINSVPVDAVPFMRAHGIVLG